MDQVTLKRQENSLGQALLLPDTRGHDIGQYICDISI